MKIKQGFMLREINNDYIVVAVGKASLKFNGMINLNETGAFLWKKLINDISKEDLINEMLNEYDVTYDIAKSDIEKFIHKLKEANIIE